MIKLDGWITIGTKLSTDKFDKQIKELENRIDSEEKKQELLNNKTKQYQTEIQKADEKLKDLNNDYDKAIAKGNRLADLRDKSPVGSARYKRLNAEFEAELSNAIRLDKEIERTEKAQNNLQNKVAQTRLQYENSTKAVDKLRGKVESINFKKHKKDTEDLNKNVNKVKEGIANTIGKIGKMALAVLGVRSAYMALRRASSTLAQYNQQYARDLEYIQFSIAQGLAPVLLKVVDIVRTLMAYINYLSQALFGVNLFANASSKAFQSMSNSASGMAKSTKEVKNNLASFDELNVLDTSKDTGGGDAGGIGAVAPSFDLSSLEDVEIPEWLKSLADLLKPVVDFFKEIYERYGPVATGIAVVVSALAGFAILKGIISLFTGLGKAVAGVSVDFTGFFNALGRAVEAIAILGGLALVINSITELIKAFSESGMTLGEVAGLLGIVLGELVVAFIVLLGAMTALKPGWTSVAGGAVILGGLALTISSVTSLIKAFSQSGMTLNDVIGLMATILLSIAGTMGLVALLGPEMTAGLIPFLGVVAGISAILTVMAWTLPTILDAVDKFIVDVAPSITAIIESIANGISTIINQIGVVLPPIIESIGGLFTSIFDGIAKIIQTVGDTIIKLQDSTIDFIDRLGPAIDKFVDGVISAVTKLINFVISGIEYLVNLVVNGINKIIEAINSVSEYVGITIPRVPEFQMPRFVPKLAKGGIVSKPTQAIIGEAGREAVMPLDSNTEWMDILADKLSEKTNNGEQKIVVSFEGTMAQFVRQLKPQIEIENRRTGTRLITGGAY